MECWVGYEETESTIQETWSSRYWETSDKHVRAVYEEVKIKIDEKPNSEENQVDKQPEENDENFAKLSQAPGKGKN